MAMPDSTQAWTEQKATEKLIDDAIMELGRLCLERNLDTPEAEYAEQIKAIKDLQDRKFLLDRYQDKLQGNVKCEKCGAIVPPDSMFCNKCGEKLPEYDFSSLEIKEGVEPVSEEKTDGTLCPSCGAAIAPGTKFCEKCGTKIDLTQDNSGTAPVCPSCGAPVADGMSFCEKCGAKVR